MRKFPQSSRQGPAINNSISAKTVRVISEKGEMIGVLEKSKAVQLAFDQGLDLVEISPNVDKGLSLNGPPLPVRMIRLISL